MCDYSLHGIKNRLANEGEQLFVHMFHTGSKGLASATDLRNLEKPQPAPPGSGIWGRFKCWVEHQRRLIHDDLKRSLPAVCIPPGARLQISDIPVFTQRKFGLDGSEQEVTFVQLTAEPFRYRDGVRFYNGQIAKLQDLSVGLRMEVLSLDLAEVTPTPRVYAKSLILEELGVG
jgi:hypothetical protein